jgi:hypothetical protein
MRRANSFAGLAEVKKGNAFWHRALSNIYHVFRGETIKLLFLQQLKSSLAAREPGGKKRQ